MSLATLPTPAALIDISRMERNKQTPEFDEFTLVLRGAVRVEHEGGALEVAAGQPIHTRAGEWVRYSTPGPEGAELEGMVTESGLEDVQEGELAMMKYFELKEGTHHHKLHQEVTHKRNCGCESNRLRGRRSHPGATPKS